MERDLFGFDDDEMLELITAVRSLASVPTTLLALQATTEAIHNSMRRKGHPIDPVALAVAGFYAAAAEEGLSPEVLARITNRMLTAAGKRSR